MINEIGQYEVGKLRPKLEKFELLKAVLKTLQLRLVRLQMIYFYSHMVMIIKNVKMDMSVQIFILYSASLPVRKEFEFHPFINWPIDYVNNVNEF